MILAEVNRAFETFGPSHLAAMAVIVTASIALPVCARISGAEPARRRVGRALAMALLINELAYLGWCLASQPLGQFLKTSLPLHVCGAAVFLAAWVLLAPRQVIYEVAYFWALAGTLQAVLTPNLVADFPSYWYFAYFIAHGGVVVGVVFATFALRMRPKRGAVLRIFVITNLYTLGAAGANWLLGANYMFLRQPPLGRSPFFFLPWPWYIAFLEAAGLAFILALYAPFWLRDRYRPASP